MSRGDAYYRFYKNAPYGQQKKLRALIMNVWPEMNFGKKKFKPILTILGWA